MANIRVDVDHLIHDGSEIKFRSPVDCSAITGLVVHYPDSTGSTVSKEFMFADAHGSNIGEIDHPFGENVVVKVILDFDEGRAFVQNADTNAYLEEQLASKAPAGFGYGDQLPVLSGTTDEINAGILELMLEIPEPYYTRQFKCQNPITGGGHMYGTIYKQNNSNAVIVLHQLVSGYEIVGQYNQGVWQEWEWVNPPYVTNVVYRTTDRLNDKVLYKKVDANGALNYSVDYAKAEDDTETGTWHKYTNMMGAAPSGFGLGDINAPATAWKYTKGSGFSRSSNGSPDNAQWWGISSAKDSGVGTHIAFSNANNILTEAKRIYNTDSYGNVAGEWEYVNPPMLAGVAYRTTERWGGKPVYAKLLNCGALPNATNKQVFVANNISNIVRVEGYLENKAGYLLQVPITTTGAVEVALYNHSELRLTTTSDQSTWDAYVTVYYTLGE